MKRLITLLLPALLALTACSLEDSGQSTTLQAGETMASFTVDLPNEFSGPQGYALKIDDDKAVSEFHVLAFDDEDKLADWATQTDITVAGDKPSFNVKFKKLTIGKAYTFVVLANAGPQVDALSVTFSSKPSYEVLMPKFIQDNGGTSDVTRIPMWGEDKVASLVNNQKIEGLKLLRMMAKINVSADLEGSDTFVIEDVRLINYRQDGHIVPDKANIGTDKKAIAPTLTEKGRSNVPLLYNFQSGAYPIYTFEADVAGSVSDPDLEEVHCLVVGGKYNNGGKSYYRVNFRLVDAQDKVTYLPLLRNHSYNIKITSVNGDGYANWEDAFASKGVSVLEAEIIQWNDADMTDIDFDGQYMLSVSKKAWTFDKEARTTSTTDNIIKIVTDWKPTWTFTSNAAWLKLEKDGSGNWHITLDKNDKTTDRAGEIIIKAGRITSKITVTQTGEAAKVLVNSVALNKHELALKKNATEKLTATVLPVDATDASLSWTTSNAAVATVGTDGTVTAKGDGTATITATAKDGSGKADACVVTVTTPVVTTIELPASAALGMTQGTLTLTPEYNPTGSYTTTWISSDETVATVANGVVTARKVGTTQITAKVGAVTSNICYLTVTSGIPGTMKGWAGSNIYWDGTKMTFDDEYVSDNQSNQGLYFKWGSLIGLEGTAGNTTYTIDAQSNTTWSNVTPISTVSIAGDDNSSYLTQHTSITDHTHGDICKYMTLNAPGERIHGKKWRMPTANELKDMWVSGYSYSLDQPSSVQTGNVSGTTKINYTLEKSGNALPASGYRNNSNGAMSSVGRVGYYWSASPNGTYGRYLGFNTGAPYLYSNGSRQDGYSVRCVVDVVEQ